MIIKGDVDKWKAKLKEILIPEMDRIKDSLSKEREYDFLKNIEDLETKRSSFISDYRKIPLGCESFLVILRRWNSYTPSLPLISDDSNISQHSIGGGYFLYIQGDEKYIDQGYGLVIDPGYNFIHNFGLAGFCLDDIDGILITHAHNDHTNDFESILSLLYQRNEDIINRKIPKKVDLFLNVGTFKKFSNYLELAKVDEKNYIGSLTVLRPGQVTKIPSRSDISCEIVTLHTKHHEMVTAKYSIGVCFKISERNILFTGDTGWDFEMMELNEEILNDIGVFSSGETEDFPIDILIPHIGTIKKDEFNLKFTEDIQTCYYDKHLGLLGVISSAAKWKPKLCVVSEFGEELIDLRESLARELQITIKKIYSDITCIPGDVGLFLLLDSKQILCYMNKYFIEWDKIEYMGIEDKSGQKRIVYYHNKDSIPNEEIREYIKDIYLYNGVGICKKHHIDKIIRNMKLKESVTKSDLIAELSGPMPDPKAPGDGDRWPTAIGKLLALSCLIDSPIEYLQIARNGFPIDPIIRILNSYQIDTRLLIELEINTREYRYGLDERAKSLIQYIMCEEAKGLIKDFIRDYIEERFDSCKSILRQIKDIKLKDIWRRLEPKRQFELIYEDYTVIKENIKERAVTSMCDIVSDYRNRVESLKYLASTHIDEIRYDRESITNEKGTPTIEECEKMLETEVDNGKRQLLIKYIDVNNKIKRIESRFIEICKLCNDILKVRGIKYDPDNKNIYHALFKLYQTMNLVDESKIERKDEDRIIHLVNELLSED